MINNTLKIAIFIDADNINVKYASFIFEEIKKYGEISINRIYGDWSSPQLDKWKNCLPTFAITPIQHFAYVKGKNTTDIGLVIDVMDFLHDGLYDIFCIVSSDSDFTRLASRIKQTGKLVYGFGETKTLLSFQKECSKFILLNEIIDEVPNVPQKSTKENQNIPKPASNNKMKINENSLILIINSIKNKGDKNGWINLGLVGQVIKENMPNFNIKNHGCSKLSNLMKTFDIIELDTKSSSKIRLKK